MEKFFIVAARRSGVTFFLRTLDSHPQIVCEKRVFDTTTRFRYFQRPAHWSRFSQFSRGKGYVDRLLRKEELVSEFINDLSVPANETRAVGLRLSYAGTRAYPQVLRWVCNRSSKVIHLVRENVLKTLVSRAAALKRGVSHSDQKQAQVTTPLNPSKLKRRLLFLSRDIERCRSAFESTDSIEVTYENFVAQREVEAARVIEFLGVDPFEGLDCSLKKLTSDSLADVIENYDEVSRALTGTPYEKFLD